MGKFTTDIAAEIQLRYDMGDNISQRVIPHPGSQKYKYYEMREHAYSIFDKINATVEQICEACNVSESIFITWQLDYLEIDLRSIDKIERYLGIKMIKVHGT